MDPSALVALLGGWTALVVAVSVWLSRLASERVLSKWRRDEQSLAETVRAELGRSTLLLEAGIREFGSGQETIRERRVAAVERLWAAVLELRERLKGPVFFFGILSPSER